MPTPPTKAHLYFVMVRYRRGWGAPRYVYMNRAQKESLQKLLTHTRGVCEWLMMIYDNDTALDYDEYLRFLQER